MSRGEEKGNLFDWPIPELVVLASIVVGGVIFSHLQVAFTCAASLSFGLIRSSLKMHFVRPHTDTALLLFGVLTFAASVGALIGKISIGTYRGAVTGCCYVCFAFVACLCIVGLIDRQVR